MISYKLPTLRNQAHLQVAPAHAKNQNLQKSLPTQTHGLKDIASNLYVESKDTTEN
jgi:hypothetical protein